MRSVSRLFHSPKLLKPAHTDSIPDLKVRLFARLAAQFRDDADALVAEAHGRVEVVLVRAADAAVGDGDDGLGCAGGAGAAALDDGAVLGAFEDFEGGCHREEI